MMDFQGYIWISILFWFENSRIWDVMRLSAINRFNNYFKLVLRPDLHDHVEVPLVISVNQALMFVIVVIMVDIIGF